MASSAKSADESRGRIGSEEMIPNRELGMDDYLAMLRRQAKVILVPALFAPLVGFAVSYLFSPKYASTSTILVEGQKVPENMVQPIVSEDLTARVATLEQQVLSQSSLQPMVERLYPNKSGQEVNAKMDEIRGGVSVAAVETDQTLGSTSTSKGKKPGTSSPVPGFNVTYTASNAKEAQQICNELTSLIISENIKEVNAAASGTSEVLVRGIEDAKRNLDDLDAKLAEFKKKYVGQLPGDEENNLKILMGLNSQLEANTQTLNRAQQDKSYAESTLSQELSNWKTSQSSTNPETLQKQLSDMQSQLLQLQARYTEDHPDVIKAKADIAEVKKKLDEINKASANPESATAETQKESASEPAEVKQTRLQIHQYSDLIASATRDQKRLQEEIAAYQGRISLSPSVEEEYKALTRDYDNAQKAYQDLLAKKSTADLTVQMNTQAQGERMFPLNPASTPEAPAFPNRPLFAGGGFGAALALGAALAMWLELRDQSIRNEKDAGAALQLPMLVAVPWVGAAEVSNHNGNGFFKFWKRNKSDEGEHAVRV